MSRKCDAIGCERMVADAMCMCKEHWFQVPYHQRRMVLEAYRDYTRLVNGDGVLRRDLDAAIGRLREAQQAAAQALLKQQAGE